MAIEVMGGGFLDDVPAAFTTGSTRARPQLQLACAFGYAMMGIRPAPAAGRATRPAALRRLGERIEAFDPGAAFQFCPTITTASSTILMPPFCLGPAGERRGRLADDSGAAQVPEDIALGAPYRRRPAEAGVDPAVPTAWASTMGSRSSGRSLLRLRPTVIDLPTSSIAPRRRSRLFRACARSARRSAGMPPASANRCCSVWLGWPVA